MALPQDQPGDVEVDGAHEQEEANAAPWSEAAPALAAHADCACLLGVDPRLGGLKALAPHQQQDPLPVAEHEPELFSRSVPELFVSAA